MPLMFRSDKNEVLRCSGWATLAYRSDDPLEIVVDDLGPMDLPDYPERLVIGDSPNVDREGRDMRGKQDDRQRHSRHVIATDVTLAESGLPSRGDGGR